MASVNGTAGPDNLVGTPGDDALTPGLGDDTVDGGAGVDTLVVAYPLAAGQTTAFTGSADAAGALQGAVYGPNGDRIAFTAVERFDLTAVGGNLNASVYADGSASGDAVSVAAGAGVDSLYLQLTDRPGSSFVVAADGAVASSYGHFSGFEVYTVLFGAGANLGVTGPGADTLSGGSGVDTLRGGAGDDILLSHGGVDVIDGGAGFDTWRADLRNATTPLTFVNMAGAGSLSNGTALTGIERAELTTGSGDDTATFDNGSFDAGFGTDRLTVSYAGQPAVAGGASGAGLGDDRQGGFTISADGAGKSVTASSVERFVFVGDDADSTVLVDIGGLELGALVDLDGGGGANMLVLNGYVGGGGGASITFDGTGPDATLPDATFRNFQRFEITLTGRDGGNRITTGEGADFIIGGAGADAISTGAGDDTVYGAGGADTLAGGAGDDTVLGSSTNVSSGMAQYSGGFRSYAVTLIPNEPAEAGLFLTDMRAGSPDGRDFLGYVAALSFADRTLSFAAVDAAVSVLRDGDLGGAAGALAATLSDQLSAGALAPAGLYDAVARGAAGTTALATLEYQFFTGATPTAAGIDYLVAPSGGNLNNLNSAYYQGFNLENRYIKLASGLGPATPAFAQAYGALSLFDATKTAYGVIFGAAPSDAKVHAILDAPLALNGQSFTRAQYFASYGDDGADGLATKASAIGWLLAEAEKVDVGTYARADDAFLAAVAQHTAAFGVDLVGAYARPEDAYAG